MSKNVMVAGVATINWRCELPVERAREVNMCEDPAVEAVLGAMPQRSEVYIWGEDAPPVEVFLEINEDDVEVEDDDR